MLTVGSPRVSWARVRLARLLARGGMLAFAASTIVRVVPIGLRQGALANPAVPIGLYLLSLGALAASLAVWFLRASLPGSIEIDPLAVRIRCGGTREVSLRDQIKSAYYVSRYVRGSERIIAGGRRAATVEVVLEDGDIVSIEVASVEKAREVIARLGFGPGQRRVTMSLGSPPRRLYHLLIGVAAYYIGRVFAMPFHLIGATWSEAVAVLALPAAMFAVYFGLKSLMREPELVVGSDGVLVRSGRKRRFLPASSIRGIEQASIALPLLIHTSDRDLSDVIDGKALDLERRGAAASLLSERFLATPPPSSRDVLSDTFARGDRSLADWKNELAGRAQAGSYRTPAQHEDDAAAVLASVRASDEERAGAALALRIAGEPKERIRIAASGVADEQLRDALEAIAEEESDEAVDRALVRLQTRRAAR